MQDIYFFTAFPQAERFLWEIQVQHYNFYEKGIDLKNVYVLISYKKEDGIKQTFKDYASKTSANLIFVLDTCKRIYQPTIRPFLFKDFFKKNPQFSDKYIFYHDSDITFQRLPDFEKLKKGKEWKVADTISYIGYEYLKGKGHQIIADMLDVVGLPFKHLMDYNKVSGGAQYFGKGATHVFWNKVMLNCEALYKTIKDIEPYKKNFKEETKQELTTTNRIQIWTAGMWSELWNIWLFYGKTSLSEELNFSWGNSSLSVYNERPVFHNSGVTDKNKDKYFYKGNYLHESPLKLFAEGKFDYIEKNTASYQYISLFPKTLKWLENDCNGIY